MTSASDMVMEGPREIAPEALFDEFTVKLPSFEGPLDLLLHLIRKHEIDIFDIPIHFITREYLAHLRLLENLDVTLSSEFLVMASTLVHIKSQMLLPSQFLRPLESDHDFRKLLKPEDPRFELVRALLGKQALEVVTQELGLRDEWARLVWTAEFERAHPWQSAEVEYDLSEVTVNALLTAFQAALTREKPAPMTILGARVSVGEIIREIRHLHRGGQLDFSFADLLAETPPPWRVVAVFLALLELARQGQVSLVQPEPGANIIVHWEAAA